MSYPEQQQQPQQQSAGQHPAGQSPAGQYLSGSSEKPKTGPLSVVAFVLSFLFFGILGVALGIFALRQNRVHGYRGNGLAWAGIIIGAVHWVVAFGVAYLLFHVLSANRI